MPVLGVDVGSTRVHVAIAHEGQASSVPALDGLPYIPSVIGYAHGRPLIGAPARAHFLVNPAEVLFSPARHLGGGAVKLGDEEHAPETLVAGLLEQAVAAGMIVAGGAIDGVALSRAAWASPEARRALAEAAQRAGINLVRTEVSTTLAAIARLVERGEAGLMILVDVGGWKVEATVAVLEPGQVRALGRSVDATIGANWLDGCLVKALVHELAPDHECRLLQDKLCYGMLREQCESMRVELSSSGNVQVSLPFLAQVLGVRESPVWGLDREFLDLLAAPLVEATRVVCAEALEHAKAEPAQIKEAFVHGGLAHMPAIREAVSSFLGVSVSGRGDPDSVVARGAALAAAASVGQLKLRIVDDLDDHGRSGPAAGWGQVIPAYVTPAPASVPPPPPRPSRPSSGEWPARDPSVVPSPSRRPHPSSDDLAAARMPAHVAHRSAPDHPAPPAVPAHVARPSAPDYPAPPPVPAQVAHPSTPDHPASRPVASRSAPPSANDLAPSPAVRMPHPGEPPARPSAAAAPPALPTPSPRPPAPAAAPAVPARTRPTAETAAAAPVATVGDPAPGKPGQATLPSEGAFRNPPDPAGLAGIALDGKLQLGASLTLPVLLLAIGRRRSFSGHLRLKHDQQDACIAIVRGGAAGSSLDMEQLRRAFEWPGGSYKLTDEPPSSRLVATRQPMVKVVMHGVRSAMRLMDLRQVLDILEPHLYEAPIVLQSRSALVPLLGLSPRESRFVEHTLDGATSMDEIMRRGGIGRETAVQLLFVLELFRALEWRSMEERAGETAADRLRQRAHKLEKADHFEALGVHWSVSRAELQRALQRIEEEMRPGGRQSQVAPEAAAQIVARARIAYQAVAKESDRRTYLLLIHPDLDFEAIESVAEDQSQWYAWRGAAAATEETARLKKELSELSKLQHEPPKSGT